MATPPLRSLKKAIDLLTRVAESGHQRSISALSADIGMPRSSAYRIAATFERSGLLTRLRRGYYLPGPILLQLAKDGTLNRVLTGVGRPVVEKLAKETKCTAHLGVFEGGMVTYLLKASRSGPSVFTREGTQLEAYCTGIGKVLLAALPQAARDEYLTGGPFIRLTPNTLIDPHELRTVLATVESQGYATDEGEMDSDLICLAVPVRTKAGAVLAELSITMRQVNGQANTLRSHLGLLRAAADAIAARLS